MLVEANMMLTRLSGKVASMFTLAHFGIGSRRQYLKVSTSETLVFVTVLQERRRKMCGFNAFGVHGAAVAEGRTIDVDSRSKFWARIVDVQSQSSGASRPAQPHFLVLKKA